MSISKFEICVLGGGPAGAIIGRRLAELGHNTVIIDRCLPAQPHRVESLAPPAPVYHSFSEGLNTVDLGEARDLLQELA
jgi:flavin-dependent dehydrogenase